MLSRPLKRCSGFLTKFLFGKEFLTFLKEEVSMAIREDAQHDLLLIIMVALFILFVTGLAVSPEIPSPPIFVAP